MDELVATALLAARRAEARAQFQQWELMLRFRDSRVRAIEADDCPPLTKRLAISAIATDLSVTLHVSETRVWRVLADAERVRHSAPTVWAAFRDGRVNEQQAALVGAAIHQLTSAACHEYVDANAVQYATTHTVAEFRAWLKRLIARLEPVEATEAADAARSQRYVRINHAEDGMSWIEAFVPTPLATAVANRLRKAAKSLDDDRTRDQKQADLLGHWLTSCEGTETDIPAEIAVTIPAESLAGLANAPMITEDGEPLPAGWITDLLASDRTFWTRLLTDESGRVLDRTVLGYQPPRVVREALRWRDGRCRVKHCNRPAEDCDLDHVIPYHAGGATTAANLQSLCRRHHGMKGHGLLDDSVRDESVAWREQYRHPA